MGVRAGRVRGRLLPLGVAAVATLAAVTTVHAAAARGGHPGSGSVADLRLFARPPVLVRSGQPVRIPVDVVCATARGTACPATATIDVREAGRWNRASAGARPGLRFDVSGVAARAARAAGGGASGSVAYRIGARAGDQVRDASGTGSPLRFYVTSDMPSVAVPPVTFGDVHRGKVALYLAWGSGPGRAGLVPGFEADTLGPTSFDVDRAGRILVADPVLGDVSLYDAGRAVRESRLPLGPRSDVALGGDGTAFVASSPVVAGGRTLVRSLDPAGSPGPSQPVGLPDDMPSELRTAGEAAYLHLLPEDDWLPASGPGSPTIGQPLGGSGQLLKVVDGRAVRLGTVVGGLVQDAVELAFSQDVGEIDLAERDGSGGYVAVVHVSQETPSPADQFEVIHVTSDGTVRTFSVANQDYSSTMPLSKFRLGQDGTLYALQSSSDGVRVVAYDLGGAR